MAYLAEKNSPDPVIIGEIAEAYNIPKQFLAKITQLLVKQQLITTVRGRKGGVMLAKPAVEIYLPQIIEAIDGPPQKEEKCLFGLDACVDEQPCPLHEHWKSIKEEIRTMLETKSLHKLADDLLQTQKE